MRTRQQLGKQQTGKLGKQQTGKLGKQQTGADCEQPAPEGLFRRA